MNEKIINIGKGKNLVGILSETDGGSLKPAVLILNSGLVHRPGPFRMNVEMAREIAKLGFNVLRIDISGIGDSEKLSNDSRSYEQRNLEDIGEFINYLSRDNQNGVIVIGLCTGADLGHRAAVKYKAVIASVLFDGYGYPTFKYYLKRYMPVLLSYKRLFNAALKVLFKITGVRSRNTDEASGVEAYFWKLPAKNKYMSDLEVLSNRKVKQFYLFTGAIADYYNYKEQFKDGFGSSGLVDEVDVQYYILADHTYTLTKDRQIMFRDVCEWLSDNFIRNNSLSQS